MRQLFSTNENGGRPFLLPGRVHHFGKAGGRQAAGGRTVEPCILREQPHEKPRRLGPDVAVPAYEYSVLPQGGGKRASDRGGGCGEIDTENVSSQYTAQGTNGYGL